MLTPLLRRLRPSRHAAYALASSQPARLQHTYDFASAVQQLNAEMDSIFGPAHPSAHRLTAAAHPAEGGGEEGAPAHAAHHFHPATEAPRLTAASQPHPLPATDASAAPLSIHVHLPASLVAAGAAAGGLHIHVHFGEGAPKG